MRIWDLHCHIAGAEGRTPDERMAKLLAYADRVGIERLVVFMGWPFVNDPTPDELKRQNDQVLQAISHYHDRAFGFAYVSPAHPEASLAEIDRCIRDGPMVGIKLWVARTCDKPEIDPIVRRAAQLDAVIFQHTWLKTTGNLPGESTPMQLAELARRFPNTPIICGHAGGNWELGIRAVRPLRNVSVDIGGGDPTAGFVEMAVRELGQRRVIYGSDAGGRSFASQIAKVQGAAISDQAKEDILSGNLRRMLSPILRARGLST